MVPLKYTIVSITTKGSTIYIHNERQIYKLQRHHRGKSFYKCIVDGCNAKVLKINYNCFKGSPDEHIHPHNNAKKFRKKIERVFIIRAMQRMLKMKGKIDNRELRKELQPKVGTIATPLLSSLKQRILKKTIKQYTGSFITVEPIQLIPLNKIQKSIKAPEPLYSDWISFSSIV